MEQIADRLVVIGRGRLIADTTTAEILQGLGGPQVQLRTPNPEPLVAELRRRRITWEQTAPHELRIHDLSAEQVGDLAFSAGVPVHRIAEIERSLEQAYLGLTGASVEYLGQDAAPPAPDSNDSEAPR